MPYDSDLHLSAHPKYEDKKRDQSGCWHGAQKLDDRLSQAPGAPRAAQQQASGYT